MVDINWGALLAGRPKSPLEYMQEQQNARLNQDKLKALIQAAQLSNQKSQALLPFAVPKEQANIKQLLADAGYKEAETQYVPNKYAIQQQNANTSSNNYNLQREINNPNMIAAIQALKQAQAAKANTESNPEFIKNKNTLAFIKSLPPALRDVYFAAPPDKQLEIYNNFLRQSQAPNSNGITPTQESFGRAAEQLANKNLTDVNTRKQAEAYQQMATLMDDTGIDDILKRATKYAGIARAPKQFWDAISGSNEEDYMALKNFKNILSTNYTNLDRRLEGLGVQKSTRQEIRHSVTGAIEDWDSNPQRAFKLLKGLRNQLDLIGKKAVDQAHPIKFWNKPETNTLDFNRIDGLNEEDYQKFLQSAPPEQRKSYIEHLRKKEGKK